MEYKEKYKEALKRAEEIITYYREHNRGDEASIEDLESIFPELKESGDEKIRRELIAYFRNNSVSIKWSGLDVKKAIEWLEKQGEQDNWAEELNTKIKELHKQCLAKIQENNTPTIVWHSIDEKPEEMKELFCEWECDDVTWHDVAFYNEESHTFRHAKRPINVTKWVYVDELLEKQVELKTPNIDEMKFKNGGAVSVSGKPFDYEHASITQKDFAPKCVNGTFQVSTKDCWRADKPKFHEGDWIIRSAEGFKHNTYLVTEVKDYYVCEELKGRRVTFTFNDVHKNFKLWDISDAKDGDVLCYETKDELRIFIYIGYGHTHYHCCYYNEHLTTVDSFFVIQKHLESYLHPASKEQRDLLFEKMHEAGYEWNEDKKELKESQRMISAEAKEALYDKPAWSGGDSFRTETLISVIKSGGSIRPELRDEFVNWLENLKDRVVPQPKQEWSEDDEHRVKDTIYFLETAKKHYASTVELDACINWLKLLKDRVQPKQEWDEEDKRIIDNLISQLGNLYTRKLIKEETKYKYVNWLKSLKNRVIPQPKQEWSEHKKLIKNDACVALTKKMLYDIILDLKVFRDKDCSAEGKEAYQREIDWLENLKKELGG